MLQIRTGCRLHFGLMELAQAQPLRFAGLGMMLSSPNFELEIPLTANSSPSSPVSVSRVSKSPHRILGSHDNHELERRVQKVVQLHDRAESDFVRWQGDNPRPKVARSLPLHCGLGAGTQLACATAVAVELHDRLRTNPLLAEKSSRWTPICEALTELNAEWLVRRTGRGLRSAVGLQGFLSGGLILDCGYAADPASQHTARPVQALVASIPERWRVVLIFPRLTQDVSGKRETQVMTKAGQIPNPQRVRMLELAQQAFGSVQQSESLDEFAASLDEYMVLAGGLFAGQQGGLYNGPDVSLAVDLARAASLQAVGQSSWGPTVFGFAIDTEQADQTHQRLSWELRARNLDWTIRIVQPCSRGALYRVQPKPLQQTN